MTTATGKKKKSILKRVLTYLGIVLLLLIAAIIIIPIFFKDELKEMALKEANKMLKADVAVGDFSLTIFSSFPKMKLAFSNVSITGREEFEGIKLIDLKSFEAKLDFWSVINMEDITVRSIKLVEPKIHVKILATGEANYDIVKSSEELAEEKIDTTSAPFKLSLSYYEIKNGDIIYDDATPEAPMYAEIIKLNHSGSGDLTAEVFDFKTKTSFDNLKYKTDGSMFAEIKNLKNSARVDVATEKMDFKTNTSMDELTYKMDGLTYLSKVKTDLDMDLIMELKEKSSKFILKDNKLKMNALSLSFDGFYEMLENQDNMDLKLLADKISFKDLLSLVPAFYHTGYENMVAKGSIDLSGFVKGKLDATNYPAWDFSTRITDASISYPDMPTNIENVNVVAGSKFPGGTDLDKMTVDIDQLKATFAGNKIDANFYLKYPMSDPLMKSKLNMDVDLATLDQVYPTTEKYNGKLTSDLVIDGRLSTLERGDYQNFNASGKLRLQEFNYASEDLPVPVAIKNLLFEFSPQQLKLADLQGKMGKSDFTMSGSIKNYMAYLFKENEELKGVFNYHSNLLNVDEIMPPETASTAGTQTEETPAETSSSAEDVEPLLVPKNIDFVLNTTINKIIYDGMNIDNLKGRVILKNEEAKLEGLSMQTLGGSVGLNGKYSTQNKAVPKLDFNYSLKNLDIQELTNNFVTIEKLAPVAKYVTGKISSDFSMTTSLKPSFEPIYNTLKGKGSLMSNSVTISGFAPLNKLSDALKIEKLKKQTIENLNAYFEFADGKMNVKPFTVKMGKINTTVGGSTSFEKDIDYKMSMNIPKEDIPAEILGIAEKAVAAAKNIPGFKMKELPAEIPVTAFITNKIDDPKIKTDLKAKIMELGGGVQEGVKEFVDDKVKEVKDTVKAVIDDKVKDVKAEVEKKKQEILDAAQKQADNINSEAKKLADKTRSEANKKGQDLIDEAGSNILKKKAAEVAAKKIKEEGEKAAKKIEQEAKSKADNVMKTARDKADKVK